MAIGIQQIHDASLVAIVHDWPAPTCTLEFSGAPTVPRPFALTFAGVTQLVVSAAHPWGPSVSVLGVTTAAPADFAMQSGDTISVVALEGPFASTPQGDAA